MCFDLLFVYCFWLFLLLLLANHHSAASYFTKNDTKNTATIKKTNKFSINKSKIGKNPMRITIGGGDDDDDERKDKRRFGAITDRLFDSSQRFMGKLLFFMPNYFYNYQNNY